VYHRRPVFEVETGWSLLLRSRWSVRLVHWKYIQI
jgi:hypothetical protein